MRKALFTFIFLILALNLYANDGGYRVIGGGIMEPVNIPDVSIEYERLTIFTRRHTYEVEAVLELYNHRSETIEQTLGFEFKSSAMIHVTREEFNDFILLVNGEPQPFEHRPGEWDMGVTHVLLYTPRLVPGKNVIYHKYSLAYGVGSLEGYVQYVLTTGARWKDGIIKEIDIFIRSDGNAILHFWDNSGRRDAAGLLTSFQTFGNSRLYKQVAVDAPDNSASYEGNREFYSLTPEGYLHKNIKNFVPDKNILFQRTPFSGMQSYQHQGYKDPSGYEWWNPLENPFMIIHAWKQCMENNIVYEDFHYNLRGEIKPEYFLMMLENKTPEQLRILRNSLYAMHGLVFNDRTLRDYFSRQYWYYPNPNINQLNIVLSQSERQILGYIMAEERKR